MSGHGGRVARKSRGQALIYVSLIMMTLLAFGMIVVDGGLLFLNRRAMQNAVDAAALAAAQNLPKAPNDALGARPVACDYATVRNAVSAMVVDCSAQAPAGSGSCQGNAAVDILVCQTYVANDSVRVTARKTFRPLFGADVGWATVTIRTQAIAVLGSLHSACIVPLFQTVDTMDPAIWAAGSGVTLNKLTKLKVVDKTSGNGLALQANGSSSANDWANALADVGRCVTDNPPQTSGTAVTNPGNMTGKLDDAVGPRIAAATAAGSPCPSADITPYKHDDGTLWNGSVLLNPKNCARMIVIPLLKGSINDYSGSKPAGIIGFLTFYINDWCGNSHCPASVGSLTLQKGEIAGYFVGVTSAGDADYQAYDGLGSKVVALLQ